MMFFMIITIEPINEMITDNATAEIINNPKPNPEPILISPIPPNILNTIKGATPINRIVTTTLPILSMFYSLFFSISDILV